MKANPRLLMVGAPWQHMGPHSGMTPLVRALSERFDVVRTAPSRSDKALVLAQRAWHKLVDKLSGKPVKRGWSPFFDIQKWTIESCAIRMLRENSFDAVLFESIEEFFNDFDAVRGSYPDLRVIGISHQPPGWWRLFAADDSVNLHAFDDVICFAEHAQRHLASALGHPRVHCLRHGVDSGFFTPSAQGTRWAGFNILFCGKWLRDFEALERTVSKASVAHPQWRFHLVVPAGVRNVERHYRLARHDSVQWYSGVSDETLRELYRQCQVLYLPLLDATANNAILEAMACGLPILTTDIGGIPDYLNETTATFISNDWIEGATEQLAWCQLNPTLLTEKAKRARRVAESELDWPIGALGFVDVINGDAPNDELEEVSFG